jgi:hypothetical protein
VQKLGQDSSRGSNSKKWIQQSGKQCGKIKPKSFFFLIWPMDFNVTGRLWEVHAPEINESIRDSDN